MTSPKTTSSATGGNFSQKHVSAFVDWGWSNRSLGPETRQITSVGLWPCPAASHWLILVPGNTCTAFVFVFHLQAWGEFQRSAWLPDTYFPKVTEKPQISKPKRSNFSLSASNKPFPTLSLRSAQAASYLIGFLKSKPLRQVKEIANRLGVIWVTIYFSTPCVITE